MSDERHALRFVYELRHCRETWPGGGSFDISPAGLVRRDKIPYFGEGYLPTMYLRYMRRSRREHAHRVWAAVQAVFFAWGCMAEGQETGFRAGRYDALKSDT